MKTNNETGCALCNSTWGEYYRKIDGQKMLFCCNICADIFEDMVKKVKEETGWKKLNEVELHGNYSTSRNCVARHGKKQFNYYFRTYSNGEMMEFRSKDENKPI